MTIATEPRTVTLRIEATPDADLSPNARVHWRVTYKAKQALAEATHRAIDNDPVLRFPYLRENGTITGPVDCQVTVYWEKWRKSMDGDNLLACLKSAYDQIQHCGLVENDSQLRHLPVIQKRAGASQGWMEVTLTEHELLG